MTRNHGLTIPVIRQVRLRQKSRVVAYRDFGRKFEFIAGDFKPTAYYAECVDLVRKLVLSGLIGLINPGTVFQSFCSVRPWSHNHIT